MGSHEVDVLLLVVELLVLMLVLMREARCGLFVANVCCGMISRNAREWSLSIRADRTDRMLHPDKNLRSSRQ
jgi:hypothetical protein